MGFGSWCCSGGMGPWLWLGIDLAWGRGYGDNAGGGVEISFRWVLMGVLNGFFFDFLWVSLHGGGGCVVAVMVSLVVVAKVGFIYLDFCCGVVAWPWVSVWYVVCGCGGGCRFGLLFLFGFLYILFYYVNILF